MMQAIEVTVMMTYIALISIAIMTIGLLVENAITGGPLRIVNYSGEQIMFGLLAGSLNMSALLFKIIAFQNERSGFITVLAYIGLVYAFLGDKFLFGEEFSLMAYGGLLLIFLLNVALVVRNATKAQ
jgi:drug/metabolite transporter (DMT)-like permease